LDREILKNTIVNGDMDAAKSETQKALRSGNKATDILDALVSGMNHVAHQFEEAEVYLPQVMVAADAMTAAVAVLEPELAKSGNTAKSGKVALGTVEGDIHDIGKALVGIMLRGAGFEVIDLGRDCKVERFWECAKDNNCNLVVVSALMSTTTMNDKKVRRVGFIQK
jgi:methanogenic corrinoid protein MtbC1